MLDRTDQRPRRGTSSPAEDKRWARVEVVRRVCEAIEGPGCASPEQGWLLTSNRARGASGLRRMNCSYAATIFGPQPARAADGSPWATAHARTTASLALEAGRVG